MTELNEMDLSKPFFRTYREGDNIIFESNLPNDTMGDFAFEYDIDGSQRERWEEYLKDLKYPYKYISIETYKKSDPNEIWSMSVKHFVYHGEIKSINQFRKINKWLKI